MSSPNLKKFLKLLTGENSKNNEHHSKRLLNSFSMNGHTLGFRP